MLAEYSLLYLIVGISLFNAATDCSGIGCYADHKDRVWPNGRNVLHMNSPQLCKNLCAGHLYAGMQFRTECHCGDIIPPTSLPANRCGTKCPGDISATCGGTWALDVHNVPSMQHGLSVGTHLGCFQDSPDRIWKNGLHRLDNNSPQLCRNLCKGYRFYGLQSRLWCMCGDTMPIIKLPPVRCPGNCPGIAGVKCGGNWTLSVYDVHENAHTEVAQHDPHRVEGPHRVGCYEDNKNRVWKNGFNTLNDNSPGRCIQHCHGFKYAGLQYGSQCHCGDFLPPKSLPTDRCSQPCIGDQHSTCGGNWAMEVYVAATDQVQEVLISSDVSYVGCYSHHDEDRWWRHGQNLIQRNTPELCKNLCADFKYAAVQRGNLCYCGETIPQHRVSPHACNMTCNGNRKLFCGGEAAMMVFGVTPRAKTDTTSHSYVGCYEDTKERVWKNGLSRLENNSRQLCKNLCVGHRYFGLESRLWCLCGDTVPPTPLDPAKCRANCPGEPSVKCGGPWAIDVYELNAPTNTGEQCGRRRVQHTGQQLISGGTASNLEMFPWHVGVYQTDASGAGLTQICGATLVTTSLAVSAAHCFWDSTLKRRKDVGLYRLVAGKLSRDWHVEEPTAQRRVVADIHLHELYLGHERQLAHDISVLRVGTPFTVTHAVGVVCVDWGNALEAEQLQPGSLGTIAGWGITEADKVSPMLHHVRLPYVAFASCVALVDVEFKEYLTEDKLCAGYVNRSISVCSGDSGSGLVFPTRDVQGERYYLRGVASVGHIPSAFSVSKCNNQQLAGFTKVSVYTKWIEQFVIFSPT